MCADRYLVSRVEDLAPHVLSEAGGIGFELDGFELADGRLELTGRWFGVQGRRFMRPSLILRADEGEIRLLADLVHKPWAAENGEPWLAAFPCDGELDAADDAELSVAPDVTVALRVPDAARSRRGTRKRDGAARVQPRRDTRAPQKGMQPSVEAGAPLPRASVSQDRVATDQTRALSSARAEIVSLRERVEELGGQLERERTRVAEELRESQRATAEAVQSRDEALAQRKEAVAQRDEALAQRKEAVAQRDEALAQRVEALAQRDVASAQHDQARRQRDQISPSQRDRAAAQRDRMAKDLERVAGEREELARASAQLSHQREPTVETRGAAPVMPGAASESSPERRDLHRLAVAMAVTALLVVALAVIVILSSH